MLKFNRTRIGRRLKKYAKNCSLHGIHYIVDEDVNYFKRGFYAVFIVGCLYATVYYGIMYSYDSYVYNSISFVTETTYLNWNTTFPAVTVCEMTNGEVSFSEEEPPDDDSVVQEFISDIILFTGSCYSCAEPCQECKRLNFSDLVKRYRKNCSSLLSKCKWNSEEFNCCDKFLPLETEYGVCFSLNSLHTSKLPNTSPILKCDRKSGPGILEILAVDDIRLYFHAPEDVPYINSDPELRKDIVFGESYNISFTVTEISNDEGVKYLPVERRHCRFPNELPPEIKVHNYYSYSSCIVQCHADAHYEFCNCTHHHMPFFNKKGYCNIDGLNCLTEKSACQKIVQQRLTQSAGCPTPTNSRPSTPNNHFGTVTIPRHHLPPSGTNGFAPSTQHSVNNHASSPSHNHSLSHKSHTLSASTQHLHRQSTDKHEPIFRHYDEKWSSSTSTLGSHENNNVAKFTAPQQPIDNVQTSQIIPKDGKDLPTPSSTPTTTRKTRRRSNLFTPSKKGDDKLKNGGDFGSGRAIPIKQGYLYKRSNKPLNKEWKKKYVTLCDDGRLTYHPSLHDYMDDVHGKEISLQYVTVKVPGQKPRGSKSIITVVGTNGSYSINDGIGGLTLTTGGFESGKDASSKYAQASGDEGMVLSSSNSFLNSENMKTETPNVKKRHRRMKSSGMKNSEVDDSDGYEFYIVSLDNKQWHFEALSSDERDDWVAAIEQQILNSLQLNESSKAKKQNNPMEAATIQSIRSRVPGNDFCVDCGAPNPDWASLNLGVLMCIECSGIHRNLGSHISRVRSLDLDEWPAGHLSVMLAIGNTLANSVWECRTQGRTKPTPTSSREEKEVWIRAKYESKEFLPAISNTMPLGQQLVDAVCASNMKSIVLVLAQANTSDVVNAIVAPRDSRTPLHLACAMGNLAVVQLLIWNNANVKAVDQDGRTCLAYANAAASVAVAKSQTGNGVNADISAATIRGLVELLLSNGCPEVSHVPGSGTLPRRRGSHAPAPFEKLPSSVI